MLLRSLPVQARIEHETTMSNTGNFDSIYIRELDAFVSIHGDDDSHEEQLAAAWDSQFKDIDLLDGSFIRPHLLQDALGLSPQDWQWALYRADKQLGGSSNRPEQLESQLVKALLAEGRAYAIRRYARKENLPIDSAMTASLPYGITALLYRFFTESGLSLSRQHRLCLKEAFEQGQEFEQDLDAPAMLAYDRTTQVQDAIHRIAADIQGPLGPKHLDREKMRRILSLVRLHFSVSESKKKRFMALINLDQAYAKRRQQAGAPAVLLQRPNARFIRGWQQQHLWPITYYYPVSIRQSFERVTHFMAQARRTLVPTIAVNELALAYASLQAAREHRRARCKRLPNCH